METRWEWTKPDKPGLWWYEDTECAAPWVLTIRDGDEIERETGWYAYIGPIPPEPLPPKKKVTQTLWLVPGSWLNDGEFLHVKRCWLSTGDTIPPKAIETVHKREVEQ